MSSSNLDRNSLNLNKRDDLPISKKKKKENDINTKEENTSFFSKLKTIRSYVTVEPLLACYVMPSVLAALAVQNMNLEKACRVNKGYSEDTCTKLINQDVQNLTEEVRQVQTLVANMAAWKSPLQTSIPAMMIIFIGAWSDRTGLRRPCMMMPIIGEFLTSVGLLLCTYYFLEWPLEAAGVIEALPPALTGGWTTMFMAVFSYISDHTTVEDRTFRIGIVNIFVSLGIPIGTSLSGILTKKLGFYGVFSISISIYIVGFLYGLLIIKDTKKIPHEKDTKEKHVFVGFFNTKHAIDTIMVAFKPRSGSRRLRVMLLMLVFIVLTGPIYGEVGVAYLFARYKFHFTEVDFSIFSTYAVIMNLIGTIVAITVFNRYFKMDDAMIGVLAGISKIAASFVYAFAPTTAWFYLGPIIDCLSGTGIIAMRSMATKLVEPSETGKVHSLFGVCEAIVPIIYSPMYSQVYVRTIETAPGAFFLLGALLTVPAVVIFMSMFILQRKENGEDTELEIMKEKNLHKEKYTYINEITYM